MSSGDTLHSRCICSIAAFTPALGLRRVVGILTRRIAPLPSRQTTSVKVPPISTPISNFPAAPTIAPIYPLSLQSCAGVCHAEHEQADMLETREGGGHCG